MVELTKERLRDLIREEFCNSNIDSIGVKQEEREVFMLNQFFLTNNYLEYIAVVSAEKDTVLAARGCYRTSIRSCRFAL